MFHIEPLTFNFQLSIFNFQTLRFSERTELWGVGALYGAGARLVGSFAIDEVFVLDDVLTFRQAVEVIVRCTIVRRAV